MSSTPPPPVKSEAELRNDRLILEVILSSPNWKCGYCLARVGCDCDPACEDYENRMGYPSPWSCSWL